MASMRAVVGVLGWFVSFACDTSAARTDAGVSDASLDAAVVEDAGVDASCRPPSFGASEPVAVMGWSSDVMEPFITRDGARLLFNDSNAPNRDTKLHVAERVDERTFRYLGVITGAESPVLDAVASVANGTLYYVSTRSYETTLSTIYRAAFDGRDAMSPMIVAGVTRNVGGSANFDAEISADEANLYLVDGLFDTTTQFWSDSSITLARRSGDRFVREEVAGGPLAAIDTEALEYAPATSPDELTIYFTRLVLGGAPRIFVSTRDTRTDAFCAPTEVVEAEGFVEGPTVAPDGAVYYHRRDDDHTYRLRRIPRR